MTLSTFLFVLILACYAQQSEALSCTKADTCTKSLYVKNTCTSGNCECETGYDVAKYGCQKKIKPTVTATTSDTQFGGYALANGDVKLSCDEGKDYDAYIWYKGGTKDAITTKVKTVTVKTGADAGDFSCEVQLNGVTSDKSDALKIIFVSDFAATKSSINPELDGVPLKAFTGQKLDLKCINIPAASSTKFALKNGVVQGKSQVLATFEYEVTSATPKLSCVVILDTIGVIESAQKDAPAAATTMPTVTIKGPSQPVKGKAASWKCNIADATAPSTTAWEWYRDDNKINSETKQTYTVTTVDDTHNGNLKCKATVGKLNGESTPLEVKAATVTHKIVSTPAKALIKGYVSMECKVEGAGSGEITYTWKKSSTAIKGFTDRMIQINEFANGDKGSYICVPSVDGISLGDSTPVDFSTVGDLSASIIPTISTNKKTAEYEDKKSYTLSCDSDYDTPGMAYVWKKDDKELPGKTSKDLEIIAENKANEYKCQLNFNSQTSRESDPLSVLGKDFVSIDIYDDMGTKLDASITILKDTDVGLECRAMIRTGATGAVKYEWKEGVTSKVKTQKYSFKVTADTTLTCIATLNTETIKKDITVKKSDTIAKPTLTVDPVVTEYSNGATYTLKCETSTKAEGMTYEFMKGTTKVGDATNKYIIKSASASDDGTYTCKATMNSLSSDSSDGVPIKVGEAGKACTTAKASAMCTGKGYTGTCTNKRCVCAKSYVTKGIECIEAGASAVVASLMGTLFLALISRLF